MVLKGEAMNVETGRASPPEAEIAALNASVVAKMRARALGASVPIPSAARAPRNGERRPLGLAPIGDADDKPAAAPAFVSGVPSTLSGVSEATLAAAARMKDVFEAVDAAVAVSFDLAGGFKAKIAEARSEIARLAVENAQLRSGLAEVRAKLGELSFVQERLQIERRGPPGHAGPRGADGQVGPRGERGERGERGQAAPVVQAWEVRPEDFTIIPRLADGSTGVPICLLALFQAFHDATSWAEDVAIDEAAHESRQAAEAEAEHSRWTR